MINELIENRLIEIYLQPIVSIKDKKIFGYEALTRATDRYGEKVSPLYLFEQAKKERLSCKLDDYIRELALEKFLNYYEQDKSVLLFLNFESTIIENEMASDFISTFYKYAIPARNIVVEVKEDRIKNTHALKNFIDLYRRHDFFIAIDDFGTGYSSFDRLEFIQPDIVKVDRSLIYNVHNNFINSEILSAISKMCHKIGAIVLSEGVEDRDEVLECIKKDIDIFQGFWFSMPKDLISEDKIFEIKKLIHYIGLKHKENTNTLIEKKKQLLTSSQDLTQKILSILEKKGIENSQEIEEIMLQDSKIQAIYIINASNGIQVGQTVIHSHEKTLFKATEEGHDHSLREYYFIAKESSNNDYLSTKYISKASGSMCRTYSARVEIKEISYIVCFDIVER